MLRTLSDEIAVTIRDRLRDMRYVIRRTRAAARAPESGPPTPEALLGQAASVVDAALTAAETISLSLVSSEPSRHHSAPRMRAFGFYFAGGEGARAFHGDMYYFLKEILRRHRIADALIHEAAFAAIHERMARKYRRLLVERTDEEEAATATAAALFLDVMAERPVRLAPPDDEAGQCGLLEAEITGAAAASLFCALSTVKPAEVAEADPLESILLAIGARYERLAAAAAMRDAKKLEALFATLVAHLP